jgi:hypothetical protein
MDNLKLISNSAFTFTLLALGVAQRLMAQQPFWLPVLAPELTLADQPATIADGNSLFLNSTEDKLELLFSAELSTKRSSDDDSNEDDTNIESEELSSSDEQQEKNEGKKNELSASSSFDHLGEQATPAVDIALPYAAGLFASWLMKVDSSMGLLTAKSITAGLAYAGHHLVQTNDNEAEEDSSEDDTYSLTLWFDTPNVSVGEFKNEIQNIIDFNEKNPSLQIDSPLVYARNPYLTGINPDSNYYKIYLPKNLSEILTDKASSLIPDPGFYFDLESFSCLEKDNYCKPYPINKDLKWTDKVSSEHLADWYGGANYQPNNFPIKSALSWAYDFYQIYKKPFDLVVDSEDGGADVKLLLQYMQEFVYDNQMQDKLLIGTTQGLDEWGNTGVLLNGGKYAYKFKDATYQNVFPNGGIEGNVYIQAYDNDWNYWLRGFDEKKIQPAAADNLYDMMKLIPCNNQSNGNQPDSTDGCYTNLPNVPLSDSYFGNSASYTTEDNPDPNIKAEKKITVEDISDSKNYLNASFDEMSVMIFTLNNGVSPDVVLKSINSNSPVEPYDPKSKVLTLYFNDGDATKKIVTDLSFSQVKVDFSGIDKNNADQVKFMFSFEDGSGGEDGPFFSGTSPAKFFNFLDDFLKLSQTEDDHIFGDKTPLKKDAFALYSYSVLQQGDNAWFPSADDADVFSF